MPSEGPSTSGLDGGRLLAPGMVAQISPFFICRSATVSEARLDPGYVAGSIDPCSA